MTEEEKPDVFGYYHKSIKLNEPRIRLIPENKVLELIKQERERCAKIVKRYITGNPNFNSEATAVAILEAIMEQE